MANVENFLQEITNRLDVVESRLGIKGGDSPSVKTVTVTAGDGIGSEAVSAFDDYVRAKVDPFVETGIKIGGKVAELGTALQESLSAVRAFIVTAGQSKKPTQETIDAMLKPITEKILVIQAFDTRDAFGNHAKALSEGIGSIMYVNPLIQTPAPHVEAFKDAAVFWINKVRKDYKERADGNLHMEWCKQLNDMFQGLYDFVKAYQKMGVQWNPQGKVVTGAPTTAQAAAKETKKEETSKAPVAAATGGISNVFAELSKIDQSSGKTAGLRHVTKDMKSKNLPPPKEGGVKKTGLKKKFGSSISTTHNPVFEIRGPKWQVDYQKDCVKTIEADQISIKNTVYIHGCEGATIVVKGKCNTITVDACKKTQVVFETVLATCEIVNSKSVKVQCNVNSPTISIDKSDGVTVYIMKRDVVKEIKFVTAKSSEMNVSYPSANEDEGFLEHALPEQFVHQIGSEDNVSTQVSDLYGH
eukprot:CAMPEP_0204833296 /NCGR_PEP_ID=MMETSP1346-20131115/16352_1 /ASSEMBLY_ACC=CAM_ASM_000771 /TAXON_ID=215587 /ORGANISM="Aplanochytrium stocchinoi, Strain GSBS06" /LENGTH=470 /DNA_ID=CAMNT_0051965727 /DNA_START=181 /DNA_END=1593 /DNA_ORIENTATION=-